jgi:hypothetical protein
VNPSQACRPNKHVPSTGSAYETTGPISKKQKVVLKHPASIEDAVPKPSAQVPGQGNGSGSQEQLDRDDKHEQNMNAMFEA